MAWIMDTYSQQVGFSVRDVVTGKPLSIGGSLGREEATGRGVVDVTIEVLKHFHCDLSDTTVVIEGFGNVGSHAARILYEEGAKVIAISDRFGGLYNPKGLDIPAIFTERKREKSPLPSLTQFGEPILHEDLFTLPCHVLIPAALAEQITKTNAPKIQCQFLIEGANGPTTLEADTILQRPWHFGGSRYRSQCGRRDCVLFRMGTRCTTIFVGRIPYPQQASNHYYQSFLSNSSTC